MYNFEFDLAKLSALQNLECLHCKKEPKVVSCGTCGEKITLVPTHILGGHIDRNGSHPCRISGGKHIDFCNTDCLAGSKYLLDCGMCEAHFMREKHMKEGCK